MADVHKKEDAFQHLGLVEIVLDHLAPFYLLRLRNLRVTVAGEIHIVEISVDIIKVDRLGLSRLGGRSRQRLPVHERVDQGRFSHI